MANKQVSSEVLQELTNKIQEIVNNYCHNLEYFTEDEVNDFFQASADEVTFYNGLINDKIESQNFLWSSKHVAEKIAQSIIEANGYTDNMIKNISSIKLSYVTSLPTSDISENTIYILKASDGTSKDTLNLYNATDGWISIGEFDISLDDYYDKTQIDTKMDLKANKTEVIANDKINQTLDSTTNSSDTVLSTSGLQVEMDKKANNDEVIKKTDITTTIDSSSTEDTIPSSKTVYDNAVKNKNIKTYTSLDQLGLTAGSETLQDIAKAMVDGSIAIIPIINGVNQSLYPATFGNLIVYRGNNNRIDFMFYPTTDHVIGSKSKYGLVYVCSYHITKDLLFGWQRICTTSVNNVPTTKITLDSKIFSDGDVYYEVKNGVCYVFIRGLIPTKAGISLLVSDSMPKSNYYILQTLSLGNTDTLPTTPITARILEGSTELVIHSNNNTKALYGSFSYPVAES